MIIVLKPHQKQEVVDEFIQKLTGQYGVQVNTWVGTHSTVLGLIGDTTPIDAEYIEAQDFVESVKRVQEPYKKANRKFHPDNTVITLPTGQKIGDGSLALIAGPCSVETEAQICEVAERVKASGATFLRGGAFKPRTSPYSFQGLQAEGEYADGILEDVEARAQHSRRNTYAEAYRVSREKPFARHPYGFRQG